MRARDDRLEGVALPEDLVVERLERRAMCAAVNHAERVRVRLPSRSRRSRSSSNRRIARARAVASSGWHQQPSLAVPHDLRSAPHIGGHDGRSCEQRLEHREREALEPRGKREHVEHAEEAAGIFAPSRPDQTVADAESTASRSRAARSLAPSPTMRVSRRRRRRRRGSTCRTPSGARGGRSNLRGARSRPRRYSLGSSRTPLWIVSRSRTEGRRAPRPPATSALRRPRAGATRATVRRFMRRCRSLTAERRAGRRRRRAPATQERAAAIPYWQDHGLERFACTMSGRAPAWRATCAARLRTSWPLLGRGTTRVDRRGRTAAIRSTIAGATPRTVTSIEDRGGEEVRHAQIGAAELDVVSVGD